VSFRLRVVEAYESGEGGYATLAVRVVVGTATVKRWVATRRPRRAEAKGLWHTSPVRGATVDALIAALGDPTASGLTRISGPIGRPGRHASHAHLVKRGTEYTERVPMN
jgi:hypothetical protein